MTPSGVFVREGVGVCRDGRRNAVPLAKENTLVISGTPGKDFFVVPVSERA
jgi:hypothetical protein